MRTAQTIRLATQKGFTLLEVLMVIGLMSMLLAGMYKVFDDWAQRSQNRTAASDILRLQNAAEEYVLANFDAFTTGADLNVFREIDINDLKTFNYLPSGYVARNAFKQDMRVFRRFVHVEKKNRDGTDALNASGSQIYINTIEVVAVSDNRGAVIVRVPNKRLLDTAQAGGPDMGVISNMVLAGTTFVNRATSVYNGWYVALAALAGAGYAATPDANGGYLSSYGIVTAEGTEPNDEWLYRLAINGRPELNRMDTDLRMNNNPIQNVGTFVADKVNVTGNAVMRGVGQGVTSDTAQAMTVEQAMMVAGATESRVNMKDTSGVCRFATSGLNRTVNDTAGTCTMQGGEVQVIAATGNATMGLTTLTADGSTITDITNVTNNTDSRGVSNFQTLTATGNMTATQQVIAPTTNVTGNTIGTQQLQAGNMTVTANSTVTGNLVAARVQPTNGYSVTSRQMDVANTATIQGQIRANALNATSSLYLNNIRFPGGVTTPGSTTTYVDTVLTRTIRCTVHTNNRTYCEPTGSHTWPNGVSETCTVPAWPSTGYSCNYFNGAIFLGTCTFTRSIGASNQAYHSVSCT
ncbi:MAG: shufflon system plasmid conjugative transfer pilus tip adhesin PilV [Alphaproteobacteria bacterium]|nr:shufflon system plasmid conjugative transfer pilus tip adhesin PilV [Alphaproteobacteria bacterium]